jgi:cellulose synthase/poly-beta-1,6-N-acetylglucosamine synthase-like glycosyltransferase
MEITKQQNKVLELSAKIDPHSLGFKIPGIQTWVLLTLFFALSIFVPRTGLTVARVMAIYLLLRFLAVAIFYVIVLINIRLTHQKMRTAAPLDGLTDEQINRYSRIHHVVVIPNFKEPVEVLSRSLQALANQSIPHEQLTVVLAMEEMEEEACAKGKVLEDRFSNNFAHFFVTYHPARMPGEIPGKAANQNWGVRHA